MDEFSDFQMAVQKPSPSVVGVGVGVGLTFGSSVPPMKKSSPGVIRFPDSSPVHSLASQSTKSDIVRSQFSKPLVPPVQKFGTNVGSRLANYDLGLSVPTPNSFQASLDLSSNPPKTINNYPPTRSNQDLLIGEEDKYSALRLFMETDMNSSTSIFEKSAGGEQQQLAAETVASSSMPVTSSSSSSSPTSTIIISTTPAHQPPIPNSTTVNSSSVFNSNLISALEFSNTNSVGTPPGDSSSDFGDFQSFTGFEAASSNSSNQSNNVPSHSSTTVISTFQSFPTSQKIDLYATTNSPPLENGNCDSDAEFGDFVSVEPAIITNHQQQSSSTTPPVSATTVCWSEKLDLGNFSISPPEERMKECQSDLDNVMDMGYFSKPSSGNESYQQPPKPVQGADNNSSIFSSFVSHNTADQTPVLDCFDKDSFEMDIKPPPPPFPILSSSNFIRTSLIRNDEVTDIDPAKWNQSEDSNNDSALEYTSYERKDFSGKSKFLDISPETRSIASLDLGSYVTVDYSETSKSFVEQNNPIQSSLKSSASSPAPVSLHITSDEPIIYDDYDKYQCFREECENEKERYVTEWTRCLVASKSIISKALSVFNGVSTSEVIREVVADEKGYSYVMNLLDIYRVSQRIHKSSERMSVSSKLGHVFPEINNLWETLTAFLLGTCVSTEICQDNSDDDHCEPQDLHPSCGVCLCSVNITQFRQFLDYGGKMYHSKCANFWVNEVDAILPSLSYVSNASNQVSKFDKSSLV